MSLEACADLVERGDPDRFVAVRAAPSWARDRLLTLYAFNLEIARAPWVTQEPLVAEMRLQWWRDAIAAEVAPAHLVMGPMHALIGEAGLPLAVLDRLVAARRWDAWREPFADQDSLETYVEDSAAGLMWLAARALGAPERAEAPVRAYGWASGLANFLRAVPELRARGRHPLPEGVAVAELARQGLARLAEARAGRAQVPAAVAPALLAGWQAGGLLSLAARDPAAVEDGRLALSEFARRGGLLWQAISGRW